MGDVGANMAISLDGYIEDAEARVDQVFAWLYGSGEAVVTAPGEEREFRTSEASAEHLREAFGGTGALVTGRRLFDLTHGWSGRHPVGAPVFVVTHQPPDNWPTPMPPSRSPDGVACAIARAKEVAGDRTVAVASADIAQQPVVLGTPSVIEGHGVTHLRYRVQDKA